jgi:YihY family inner membrane protein
MDEQAASGEPDRAADHLRDAAHRYVVRAGKAAKPWVDFWTKLNNDWVFNLSGLLAYNFLMSLFPVLLVLLAAVGFTLGNLAPQVLAELQIRIEQLLPGGAEVVAAVTNQLTHSAKPLFVIGILTACFTGSRLFLVLENCFGVIFRVRGRHFVRQNLMAFGMLVLYVVLVPIITVASIVAAAILTSLAAYAHALTATVLTYAVSAVVWIASSLLLFGGIYVIVPNRRMRLREIWPGTLLASVLLILYEVLFPLYVSRVLHPDNYGSLAGFAIVILLFFYYLAFILLLGAEVNSWIVGLRPTPGDPQWVYQRLEQERADNNMH